MENVGVLGAGHSVFAAASFDTARNVASIASSKDAWVTFGNDLFKTAEHLTIREGVNNVKKGLEWLGESYLSERKVSVVPISPVLMMMRSSNFGTVLKTP